MRHQPPKLPASLLKYFSNRFATDDIQGDLYEIFQQRCSESETIARFAFWRDTMLALPTLWKLSRRYKRKYPRHHSNMIKSNLKLSVRHMLKRPGYSFTTIAGLSLGIAVCLLIFYYIHFELSFDRFHKNFDNLVSVNYEFITPENQTTSPSVPYFVGPKMQREFPEVANQCRILPAFGTQVVHAGDNVYEERSYAFADATLFQLFDFKLLQGNPADQLKRTRTLVLTESYAQKYFGTNDVIGKTIMIGTERVYEVTGVMADVPSNSHFTFDYVISFASLELPEEEVWNSPNYSTYLLLQPGVNHEAFEEKVNNKLLGENERLKEVHVELHIQDFGNIHFDTTVAGYADKVTDRRYIVLFSVVAVLILFIASINYVNLATARSAERGREVGIRKAVGATPRQLFRQFMTDSVVHLVPSVAIAIGMFGVLAPMFDSFMNLGMRASDALNWEVVALISITIFLAITFFAGFYPAIVLSRFRPSLVLKGKFTYSNSARVLRKGLVVFQFCVSITLIVATMIIASQLEFMQNAKLGFDKSHTLIMPLDQTMQQSFPAIRNELTKLAPVQAVVPASTPPTEVVIGYGAFLREGQEEVSTVGAMRTNADAIPGLGMQLVRGENFDPTRESVTDAEPQYIVNQTFLKTFNFGEDEIIGHEIYLGIAGGKGKIIGVVEDFHTASLQKKIEPVVLYDRGGWMARMMVKLHPGDVKEQLSTMEAAWKKLVPHRPFSYTFLDDNYNKLYAAETRMGYLLRGFSALAVLIACMGILGLISYATVQRTKEIGIRKVLGASVPQVMVLIGKDFIKLVLVAFALSVPLAYYAGQSWLQHFEYRIGIDPMLFVIAGVLTLALAMLTVSYQAVKASLINPADTLRTE